MPKYTRNTGKEWTRTDGKQLRDLARAHTPTRVIALQLGRTPAAVYTKAAEESISLGTRKTARS